MNLIGESTSRVRSIVKATKEDAFVTDRLIFSMLMKYAKLALKKQQKITQMSGFNSFFKTLPCVELVELDSVANCCGISSGITIKRTKEKIPTILEGSYGPMIRIVTSIDGYTDAMMTTAGMYASLSKLTSYKYNKTVYFWLSDNYLYFPDVNWDSVSIEAIFEDDISDYLCDTGKCVIRQEQELQIPDYLLAEIEQQVIKDFTISLQIPSDQAQDDKQNLLR